MKPSLNKALVLSLSVLLITASGCERRGRAPAKPTAPTNGTKTQTDVAPPTKTDGTVTSTTASSEVRIDVPTLPNEAQLETDANLECKALAIVGGKISVDEFVKDLKVMNEYLDCMRAAGFRPICKDEAGKECTETTPAANSTFTIDADPESSPVKDEFVLMSKEKGPDVAAAATSARLELSVIRLGKMATKYSAGALKAAGIDADAKFEFEQSAITINGTLLRFAKIQKALEDDRANVEAMGYDDDADEAAALKARSNAQQSN